MRLPVPASVPGVIVALAFWAGTLALAGCGDQDEPGGGSASTTETPTAAGPSTTSPGKAAERGSRPDQDQAPTDTGKRLIVPSPERRNGGAGDETPIGTDVVLTADRGRVTPQRVRVPPFIALRVELRSVDGGSAEVTVEGRTLSVGASRTRSSIELAGLRPGDEYVARSPGGGDDVRIEASAEPGP